LDEEGRISIDNNTLNTIYSYTLQTENSNELFMHNLGRTGNDIYPLTGTKSYAFLNNTQIFETDIIEKNSQKDTLFLKFTTKVLNDGILWDGELSIVNPDTEVVTTKRFKISFDSDGNLITPTPLQSTLLKILQ